MPRVQLKKNVRRQGHSHMNLFWIKGGLIVYISVPISVTEGKFGIAEFIAECKSEIPHIPSAIGILVKVLRIIDGSPTIGVKDIVDAKRNGSLILFEKILAPPFSGEPTCG